ncbi:ankyrin-3-like [Cloeon dipterum]|uniref:ankyrin-3-like n=1 Tax=Cloeon dipterum TaxID=197152 RepID=UPI00321F9963
METFRRLGKTKFTFILLILATIPYSDGASIEFQDTSVNHWKFMIGANDNEFLYDFCQYNASSTGVRCKNFPKVASIEMDEKCRCSIQRTTDIEKAGGFFRFSVSCENTSSSCPKKLSLIYEQGSTKESADTIHVDVLIFNCLLAFSTSAFFIFIVLGGRQIFFKRSNTGQSPRKHQESSPLKNEVPEIIIGKSSNSNTTSEFPNPEWEKNIFSKRNDLTRKKEHVRKYPFEVENVIKTWELVLKQEYTNREGLVPRKEPDYWSETDHVCLDFYLMLKSDPTKVDDRGKTCLHCAAQYGHLELVGDLLKSGTEVDLKDKKGWTALHYAARYNQVPEIVEMLLDHGADVNLCDKYGRTALSIVASDNPVPKLFEKLLDKGADLNFENVVGMTPLHLVARRRNPALLQNLIDHGAEVNLQNRIGWSALHFAAEKGLHEMVQKLLDNHADVNLQRQDGWTALHITTLMGFPELTKKLLENGADVNVQNKNGWTALHIATNKNNKLMVQLLLDHGADVNLQTNCGQTAFQLAVKRNHLELAKLLLRRQNGSINMPLLRFKNVMTKMIKSTGKNFKK